MVPLEMHMFWPLKDPKEVLQGVLNPDLPILTQYSRTCKAEARTRESPGCLEP